MSMFSRNSRGNQNQNGNYGSNRYQKKGGFFGGLLNMVGSGGRSNDYNNQNTQNYNQQMQNQQPVGMTGSVCGKCNSQIAVGAKFCLECGEKVNGPLFCLECGEKLPLNAKFCLNCGTKTNAK